MEKILEAAAGLPTWRLKPGDVLVAEGQRTGRLYILSIGTLEVVRDGSSVAAMSQPGSVIGELAVLLDEPHTATVRTRDGAIVHVVDNPTEFMDANPAVSRHIATTLAQRLQKTTAILVDMRKRSKEREDHELFEKMFALLK
jgi:CRP/FNR family transcriptional regulator, cyclic AMP receptor protein